MKFADVERTLGCCSHHPEPVHTHLHLTDEVLIQLDNIGLERDSRVILKDVNLTVNRGDFVAVTGPNGGGKTTMLRIILGLIHPGKGRVLFPSGRPSIGYLPQKNMIDSHFPITVGDVVLSGLLANRDLSAEERRARLAATLEQIEMEDLAGRPIGRLSGGQLQRALLGRAIISRPSLLVLDEPLSYIDKHFEAHIYRLLAAIAPQCTTLLVSHEMSTISAMANRHVIVDRQVHECPAAHHYITTECVE